MSGIRGPTSAGMRGPNLPDESMATDDVGWQVVDWKAHGKPITKDTRDAESLSGGDEDAELHPMWERDAQVQRPHPRARQEGDVTPAGGGRSGSSLARFGPIDRARLASDPGPAFGMA